MSNPTWQRRLSDILLLTSFLILMGVGLFWVQSALAAQQLVDRRYLISTVSVRFPLPSMEAALVAAANEGNTSTPLLSSIAQATTTPDLLQNQITPLETTEPSASTPSPVDSPTVVTTETVQNPADSSSQPQITPQPSVPPVDITEVTAIPLIEVVASTATVIIPATEVIPASTEIIPIVPETAVSVITETVTVVPTEAPFPIETPFPPLENTSKPIVRLVIPALYIDRAVIPIGVRPDQQGNLQWDTDILFATQNRLDLIGHLITSVNPGDGGNIILAGHNYDNGWIIWEGVFVNLKTLSPGSEIIVYTEGGGEYRYIVQLVKKVPWRNQNGEELEKHQKFLNPTESEQLTLVTCGGANIWPWPARIYVVAVPANSLTP